MLSYDGSYYLLPKLGMGKRNLCEEEPLLEGYQLLQPLLECAEGLKGLWRKRSAQPLVSCDQRLYLSLDHAPQLPHNAQIRVNVSSFLLVPDLLAVQVDFETAICTRS